MEPMFTKTPMHPSEQKARALIANRTTFELVADFEQTNKTPGTAELYQVREWLMDELEKRDQEAFENWLFSNEDSPREFYIGEPS